MKTKVNDLCVKEIDFIILSILRNIFWKDVFNSWTKVTEITNTPSMKMYGLTPK